MANNTLPVPPRLPQQSDAVAGLEGQIMDPTRPEAVSDRRTVSQDPISARKVLPSEPNLTLQTDGTTKPSETDASFGVKLGSSRYVLGISLAFAAVAGIVIWNVFSK